MSEGSQPPGWYAADGDPPGTVRWWDGGKWVGGPQQQGAQQQAGYVAPGVGQLANGQQLADPWLRLAAKVIDWIISLIISIPFGLTAVISTLDGDGNAEVNVGLAVVGSIVVALYFTLMNTFFSGTVGKLILGLRIVKADGTQPLGTPVGPIRSFVNLLGILSAFPILGLIVSLVVLVISFVSLVFLFTDDSRRTVADRVADTYVIKQ